MEMNLYELMKSEFWLVFIEAFSKGNLSITKNRKLSKIATDVKWILIHQLKLFTKHIRILFVSYQKFGGF